MFRIFTVLCHVLLSSAVLFFAIGFFPRKPYYHNSLQFEYSNASPIPPVFEKVILMVVDALRSDFVYSSSSMMNFTHSLIRSAAAIPFTARASAPTVTLPKIKALTTGTVPSFLDAILNVFESDTTSSLRGQDNWLQQFKQAKPNDQLIMFGDNTWLKLFPGLFARHDGTSSFFVSDYTEVDFNVTRHVEPELKQDDWGIMVLHFLGLDHIGHKYGSHSTHMPLKQTEMDNVVKTIYNGISSLPHQNSTLLVLLGDHGMTDDGNHGGSSPSETSPATLLISPHFQWLQNKLSRACPVSPSKSYEYFNVVDQVDLVPTLAALLGFHIPRNSIGVVIPEMLPFITNDTNRVEFVRRNAQQVMHVSRMKYPNLVRLMEKQQRSKCVNDLHDSEQLSCLWNYAKTRDKEMISGKGGSNDEVIRRYLKFCYKAKEILGQASIDYKFDRISLGLLLCVITIFISTVIINRVNLTGQEIWWKNYPFRKFMQGYNSVIVDIDLYFWILLLVLHSMSAFASSFVEAESLFWNFATATWILTLFIQRNTLKFISPCDWLAPVSLFLLQRISSDWNASNQLFSILLKNNVVLWSLFILTIGLNFPVLRIHHLRHKPCNKCARCGWLSFGYSILAFLLLILKISTSILPSSLTSIYVARIFFAGSIIAISWLMSKNLWMNSTTRPSSLTLASFEKLLHLEKLIILILICQSNIKNAPLFLFMKLQEICLARLLFQSNLVSPWFIVTSTTLFSHSSFFNFQFANLASPSTSNQPLNNNAIAAFDLSNAYNGLSTFSFPCVALLSFISNWAGPIWWSISRLHMLFLLLLSYRNPKPFSFDSSLLSPLDRLSVKVLFTSSRLFGKPFKSNTLPIYPLSLELFVSTNLLLASTISFSAMMSAVLMRNHLFIWSVFTPRLLHATLWSLLHHLLTSNALFLLLSCIFISQSYR